MAFFQIHASGLRGRYLYSQAGLQVRLFNIQIHGSGLWGTVSLFPDRTLGEAIQYSVTCLRITGDGARIWNYRNYEISFLKSFVQLCSDHVAFHVFGQVEIWYKQMSSLFIWNKECLNIKKPNIHFTCLLLKVYYRKVGQTALMKV